MKLKIIGAGLAGCEAAYQAAKRGVEVTLVESKPIKHSAAHILDTFAELVCSNSLKSEELSSGSGLIKQELKTLDSLLIDCANACRVPAGSALAVNREEFSSLVTKRMREFPNIKIVNKSENNIIPQEDEYVIVATGPLTNDDLLPSLRAFCGEFLSFYDAVAPIVTKESIDMSSAFYANRYGKGRQKEKSQEEEQGEEEGEDYLNCPLTKEEFSRFWENLIEAERVVLSQEEAKVFESCMPVEIMAQRGMDTIRYAMFKPVGLKDSQGNRPYAVMQLRKENKEGTLFNLVGCQTNMLFKEQKRVFSLIPALKNAEFSRYGVMHKNIFINSPRLLEQTQQAKSNGRILFAGQITGVEGYCESIASGLMAGINVSRLIYGKPCLTLDNNTMIGALSSYIVAPNVDFQPMNANYGLLPPLDTIVKDKREKKLLMAQRSLNILREILQKGV